MHTRVEGDKIICSIEVSLSYDQRSAGFMVVEQDGPSNAIHWGPIPWHLVDAFLKERAVAMSFGLRRTADAMFDEKLWTA